MLAFINIVSQTGMSAFNPKVPTNPMVRTSPFGIMLLAHAQPFTDTLNQLWADGAVNFLVKLLF